MSRTVYESLFDGGLAADPAEQMVRDLAHAGRLHRAAHDLATDEMLEGTWVEALPDESQMRLAADDRSQTVRTLSGGGYSVQVSWTPLGIYTAEQTAGPGGATLRVGGDWIPLQSGTPADLPIKAMPETLILVDRTGKEITLR